MFMVVVLVLVLGKAESPVLSKAQFKSAWLSFSLVNTNYSYIADDDFLLAVLDPPSLLAPELQPLQ